MDELRERCRQHFTAAEFVEFLGIDFSTLWDSFDDLVEERYSDIVEEVCFEFESDTAET